MRRSLVMLLGLGLVLACAYAVTLNLRSDSDDAGQPDVVVMPYPRTSKPLPVPEVRIGSGPWQDPLPTQVAPLTKLPPSFKRTPVQIPKFDSKGSGGQLTPRG